MSPFSIISINPIQKYQRITELFAYIPKILVAIENFLKFLLSINFFDFFWNVVQHQNYRSKSLYYRLHAEQFNECQYQHTHQDLLLMSHPLFYRETEF